MATGGTNDSTEVSKENKAALDSFFTEVKLVCSYFKIT